MMDGKFKELIRHKQLLYILTWRDIRIRYKQSVMGLLWAVLMPAMVVAAGILVRKAFSILSGVPIAPADIASVSVKALPWTFFIGSIRFATASLTSNSNLVTKIYFPREVFPLSTVLTHLFDLAVATVVLVVFLTIMRIGISAQLIWLPFLLTILIILTAGVGMFLSCANLFFRDVKYIVEVMLTFGIFFTPVFYDASMFGEWAPVILLNPVGAILESINNVVVLKKPPDLVWVTYSTIWAIVCFVGAWKIFGKTESQFAENI